MSTVKNIELKQLAEFALIRAFPDFVLADLVKPSREKGLYLKLIKEADTLFTNIDPIDDIGKEKIEKIMEAFVKSTGWDSSKGKHVVTYISFLLVLMENSKHKYSNKLYDIFKQLIIFYERGGNMPNACLWAGTVAYKKWEHLFKN